MEKENEKNEKSRVSRFQWFLYVVFIPLIFAIIVALIISTIAGVNVVNTAKQFGQKLPVVGSLMQANHPKKVKTANNEVVDLQKQLKEKDAQISQLQANLDEKSQAEERSKLENVRLQKEMNDILAQQNQNKRALKDLIKTYETMPAKKAAPIITQMNDTESVKILSAMKTDALAAILENLNPKDAAKFTQLLTNEKEK